jgi:lysophospholipase L1-like esterase
MRILVFGDSLCYFGPAEAMPIDEPRLWPNRMAAALDAEVSVFAGIGWTLRDAFWSLTDNPSVWALLPDADVVVVSVGGMDTLPSPLPTYLRQGIRYLRTDSVRRPVRAMYQAAQPVLSRLPGGRVGLPPAVSARFAERFVRGLWSLRPGLPVIGALPSVHRAPSYGFSHAGYRPQVDALSRCYAELGVPTVDLAAAVSDHVRGGHGNPDGIHWGWPGHAAVADAFIDAIKQVLDGSAAR